MIKNCKKYVGPILFFIRILFLFIATLNYKHFLCGNFATATKTVTMTFGVIGGEITIEWRTL